MMDGVKEVEISVEEMEKEQKDSPSSLLYPVTVKRTLAGTGARISAQIKEEPCQEIDGVPGSDAKTHLEIQPVKEEVIPENSDSAVGDVRVGKLMVKEEPLELRAEATCVDIVRRVSFDDFLKATDAKVMSEEEALQLKPYGSGESPVRSDEAAEKVKMESEKDRQIVPWEMPYVKLSLKDPEGYTGKGHVSREMKKEESSRGDGVIDATPLNWAKAKLTIDEHDPGFRKLHQKHVSVKSRAVEDRTLSCAVIEDGDFPVEPDWFMVGGEVVNGMSTTKGRKLVDNEIVHFKYSTNVSSRNNTQWILRFWTKRNGEIGRVPVEWAKYVIPLMQSSKVKVYGRCVAVPENLQMMQEIMLYVSFYIHRSIFTEGDMSWKLDGPSYIDSTIYPLMTIFKLLKIEPYQKAEFTPDELNSRKRLLNIEGDAAITVPAMPASKRSRGSQPTPSQQNQDEQSISESSLNKIVGAAEIYDLEEKEPPSTLMCHLRPYQKQALFWMSRAEEGLDVDRAAKTLHPCWAAYRICDKRASSIYVNIFTGEATMKFPTAMQMARGGILADAMGLGKTVMTIALILSKPGRGSSEYQNAGPGRAKGGTLIICPMALLSQWKDELETHSEPNSISIFIHYGGVRTNDPMLISKYDVVLTTYGVLSSAYKHDGLESIFHRVDWYRVVLDEAHTIKSCKTQCAQSTFALLSHCRWCLTGTPLQNNLEDLYSLLCFLRVEPWRNWAWWSKLIQKPYENGDYRGMKLVKAILKPLMLRRTKETRDKQGRPILVLPPTDIQIIECEQTEAEYNFYDALFKRSKDKFDEFVAQGNVLQHYANILELLLRLRQCCNHPFLVMSHADTQKYPDLNRLARKFLEDSSLDTKEHAELNKIAKKLLADDPASSKQIVPSKAYIKEVVEDIRRGEHTECPICLESADDAVLTPCAHRLCRECLLSCWQCPQSGKCPVCRQFVKQTDLISFATNREFQFDVEKNWKESSKVSKLLKCLEWIRKSGSGEKSIVFSQWTSFLDLLEISLNRKNVRYLRYDGQLSQKQRERVLKEFNETNEKMVLLMSLRAGGVGLNLTAASNVFLMDPWWNPAVEEQAIMRIHRIGQKRTVKVRRFIVKETIEDRLQQVQARKQRMIAGALTDDEVRSARIEELKMLFR